VKILNDSVTAARALLGYKLVYETPEGRLSGYIVETEAYHQDDPASHTFRGQTVRNTPMFGPAGTVYVYFTYGMHYCMNIVTGEAGHGQGVLIRALQPIDGLAIMKRNRGMKNEVQLTNGPAKLTQALGVGREMSGTNIVQGPIHLEPGFTPEEIVQTVRIGIKQGVETPWRFYIKDNPFVSKK
jgi:DNA-3-methyladenine glycosylase